MVEKLEHYGPLIAILSLALGMLVGAQFSFGPLIAEGLDLIVSSYGVLAPLVIYFVLAPSLLKIIQQQGPGGTKFTVYTTLWFSKIRAIACTFGVVLVSLFYGLPLFSPSELNLGSSLFSSNQPVGQTDDAEPLFLCHLRRHSYVCGLTREYK